jgi:hypothetical protein
MKKTGTILSTLLAILILNGCHSTLKVYPLRYESPEVIGQGQHQAAISINPEQRVDVGIRSPSDFANPTITTEQPEDPPNFPDNITITNIPIFEIAYWARDTASYAASMTDLASYAGVNDSLDIYLDTQYGTPIIRAKYQMLGEPASRARAGNLSLALDGGYGAELFADKKGLELNAYDAALIGGFRIADTVLIYGGPYYSRYDYKDANGPSTSRVESTGTNLGIRFGFGKNDSIYLETSHNSVNAGASRHEGDYYGISLEFRE